jgi:IMP dehydrogenase
VKLTTALTFDDVMLKPQPSNVPSRRTVDTSFQLGGIHCNSPIFSSPMDTVTEFEMARAMSEIGGIGIVHRNMPVDDQCDIIRDLVFDRAAAAAAVGVQEDDKYRVANLILAGAEIICVDVAHAANTKVLTFCRWLQDSYPGIILIAGNVATKEETRELLDYCEPHAIRVGIGSGSICTTRIVTGHGVPQITAIDECAEQVSRSNSNAIIIADGGIRNSGDIVKALAAGANAVMLGSMLAGCSEAPGKILEINGRNVKEVRGMSSDAVSRELKADSFYDYAPEGIVGYVQTAGDVTTVIRLLNAGVRAGMSLSGAHSIEELQERAEFCRITPAGMIESRPHDIMV